MSKKVLVIPDVHGSIYWKSCINRIDEFDYIVQLGDWFDTWHNDWVNYNQIDNLGEFIDFKKKYPDKVYALIGNHDLGYLMHESMSGHQNNKEIDIREALIKFAPFMDIACKIDKYVYSHAGFSKTWMKNNHFKTIDEVNASFHDSAYEPFRFDGLDSYGDDITQGPTWIRPYALCTDMYFNHQVVGHTEYLEAPIRMITKTGELIIVDCPKHEKQYVTGDKVNKEFKAAQYRVGDIVEYIGNDNKHLNGEVRVVNIEKAYKDATECEYSIVNEDQLLMMGIVESRIVKKINTRGSRSFKVNYF